MSRGPAGLQFEPGDNVRWYASKYGWALARRNIFVEGETDASYLNLASRLYTKEHGLKLLSDDLKVLSVGFGNAGGTDCIKENLLHLWKLIDLDCNSNGRPLFRAIVLLDNDYEGSRTCQYLTDRYIRLRENRDVFVLKRLFPRESQDPRRLVDIIKNANAAWHDLDCEIEDLLSKEILDVFVEDNPGAVQRQPVLANGCHHFDFTTSGKSALCRWVPTVANLNDVTQIVELLKSLRYYLGLKAEGD